MRRGRGGGPARRGGIAVRWSWARGGRVRGRRGGRRKGACIWRGGAPAWWAWVSSPAWVSGSGGVLESFEDKFDALGPNWERGSNAGGLPVHVVEVVLRDLGCHHALVGGNCHDTLWRWDLWPCWLFARHRVGLKTALHPVADVEGKYALRVEDSPRLLWRHRKILQVVEIVPPILRRQSILALRVE